MLVSVSHLQCSTINSILFLDALSPCYHVPMVTLCCLCKTQLKGFWLVHNANLQGKVKVCLLQRIICVTYCENICLQFWTNAHYCYSLCQILFHWLVRIDNMYDNSLNEYLLDRGLGLVAKGTDCCYHFIYTVNTNRHNQTWSKFHHWSISSIIIRHTSLWRCLYTCHRYSKQREWDSWVHKPGLTHLSLVRSPGPSVVLCMHYQ